MITNFELISQFKPFYKAGKSFCLTSDKYIIADDGENINYINCENFHLVKTLNDPNETITCFVANPDDYTVIMANTDLLITKIDRSKIVKRSNIRKSGHTAPIYAMCLDKTSTRLATGGADCKVRISHIGEKEGKDYTCIHHKSKINILKYHPSRPVVVSVSMLEHEVVAWNTDNGRKLGIFEGHQNSITAVDFHDTKEVMVTASRDQTVLVWNCETFARQCLIPVCEAIESCIILRDNTADDIRLMVGGERGIMAVVSVQKRVIVQEFKKASLFANAVQGESLKQDGLKTIRNIIPLPDLGVAVVRESDNIEFYSDEMVLRYELAGQMSTIKEVLVVGENRDMVLVIESAPYMRLFDCAKVMTDESGKCTQWPSQLVAGGHSAEIMAAWVFDSGKMVVSGSKDGLVCVWRVDVGDARLRMKLVTSLACEGASVSSLCVDNTGSKIYVNYALTESMAMLSLTNDTLTKLCDIYKPHTDLVSCMDVNVDGSLLATGSKDKSAKVWSYHRKKNQFVNKGTLTGHRRGIWSVRFSAIERLLMTASMDKSIKLWSLDNLEVIAEFPSDNVIYKALFSRDEKQVISCNEKGFVTIWSIDKKVKVHEFKIHDGIVMAMNLLYNDNGEVAGLVAAGDDSMMCLYKDVSKKMLEEAKKSKEEQIQFKQEYDNLVTQKQFTAAFKLAIKLNKPVDAYEILDTIDGSRQESEVAMSPFEFSQKSTLAKVFKTLSKDELLTLMQFATKWTLNNRTYLIGEAAFIYLLCNIANKELIEDPSFVKHIDAFEYFKRKRYVKCDEAIPSSGLYAYFSEIAVVKELEEFRMDTE